VHEIPDVIAATAALRELHERLDATLAGVHADDDAAPRWSLLAAQLVTVERQARSCRDIVLVAARRAGAKWSRLETDTGLPDSTLYNRYARARAREGHRGEPVDAGSPPSRGGYTGRLAA